MEKIKLIISREYWTRVKKRSFIIATLLMPIGFGLLIFGQVMIFKYQGSNEKTIKVVDNSNLLDINASSMDTELLFFQPTNKSVSELKQELKDKGEEAGFDAILEVPAMTNLQKTDFKVNYYADKSLGMMDEQSVKSKIRRRLRNYKITQFGLDKDLLDKIDTKLTVEPMPIDDSKADNSTSMTNKISYVLGMLMGFMMYISVFVYGMMVLRSVMEEKTNRIVEVMISSVKPFQLMMGKIIGVGLVGFTQFVIWALLIFGINMVLGFFLGLDGSSMPADGLSPVDQAEAMDEMQMVLQEIGNINWWKVLPLFLVYFLGGYFMYASLFAAVGSAMSDDLGESQSLTLPITLPVIFAIFIMMTAINAPDSALATFGSIFPLFSPIVMPALLPMDIPTWQIIVSLLVMISSVIFFIWLSAKIYRVGIFMYGKKVNFKEIWKWMFY